MSPSSSKTNNHRMHPVPSSNKNKNPGRRRSLRLASDTAESHPVSVEGGENNTVPLQRAEKNCRKKGATSKDTRLKFHEWMKCLKAHKSKYGHVSCSYDYMTKPRVQGGHALGRWLANMRHSYRQFRLGQKPCRKITKQMIKAMEDCGVEWNFDDTKVDTSYVLIII